MAQGLRTGVITDANGEPLVGVSVLEQGTQNGTTTDANGRYRLTTTKANAKLRVSYTGYEAQIISPGQNAQMKESNETLNELVVVGYGTMRRKDVTSSITTVNAKDLNQGVFTDPAQMLQGKVPGLFVTSTGDPNGSPSISLRGASSLRSGEAMQPYYVIDGIPGVDISMVAPTTSSRSMCCATPQPPPSMARRPPMVLSSSPRRKERLDVPTSAITDM